MEYYSPTERTIPSNETTVIEKDKKIGAGDLGHEASKSLRPHLRKSSFPTRERT
jgi:hypothetical protein